MKTKLALLAAALCISASAATASSITYDVRNITNASFADYKNGYNSQGSAITSTSLSAFNGQTGLNNGYDHLKVTFDIGTVYAGSTVQFQFAPDAGYGGALYVNGSLASSNPTDLWWNYSWNAASELLTYTFSNIANGSYTIDLYWAEGCCNGGQGARFQVGNGNWQDLSVSNLNAMAVPEPGSLALLGIGLTGFALSRRKRV